MKKMKLEEIDQMVEDVRNRNMRQANEVSLLTAQVLREVDDRAAHCAKEVRTERRHVRQQMALAVVMAVMPLAVTATAKVCSALPQPDGYVMNIGANRTAAFTSIDFVLKNL